MATTPQRIDFRPDTPAQPSAGLAHQEGAAPGRPGLFSRAMTRIGQSLFGTPEEQQQRDLSRYFPPGTRDPAAALRTGEVTRRPPTFPAPEPGVVSEGARLLRTEAQVPIIKRLTGKSLQEFIEPHLPRVGEERKVPFTEQAIQAKFGIPIQKKARVGALEGMAADSARLSAGLLDFFGSPEGVIAAAVAMVPGGQFVVPALYGAEQAAATPEAIQRYLDDPTPDNLQQALLTPGFAALLGSVAGKAGRRLAGEGLAERLRTRTARPDEASMLRLPKQTIEAPAGRPSRVQFEPDVAAPGLPEPPIRSTPRRAGAGKKGESYSRALDGNQQGTVKEVLQSMMSDRYTREYWQHDLSPADMIRNADGTTNWRETVAKNMFEGIKPVEYTPRSGRPAEKFTLTKEVREKGYRRAPRNQRLSDVYGDEFREGQRVTTDTGKRVKLDAILTDSEGNTFGATMTGKKATSFQTYPLDTLTVRPKPRAQTTAPGGVRMFGETDVAHGQRLAGEAGSLYANPLIPLTEAYTRLIGRPLWEKAVGLLWRMTPDFVQRAIRERPSLIRERVPGGEAYLEARGEARGFIAEKVEAGFELGERLTKDFSASEQQALGRMIKGEATAAELRKLRNDPAFNDAIEAAKAARVEFDNLGSQAVIQGLLKEETFFTNYGKYMPRLYRKHEMNYQGMLERFGERKPNRLDRSRFLKRKDIPEHIRMMMGEIKEPGLPVAKGIAQMGHDVGNMRLFNTVADNPVWAGKTVENLWRQHRNPADFVQMPETPKLGRLSGQWVDKWIADDLNQIIRARSEMEKVAGALVGEWKYSKVVLNPSTHARNMMSNTILAHLGGLPMTRMDIYYRGLRELASKGELYQEAKAASQGKLARGTFAGAEFNTLLDSWNKTGGSLTERIVAMRAAFREGKPSQALQQVRISQTRIGQKLGDLYQAEEQWFKMSKYIHNRERGLSPREAWADAEHWLFDYSEVPQLVHWSRMSPVGAPFITFTYKALPVVAESIVTAPWRMGAIMASLYYLNEFAADELGFSEQQRREIEAVLPERMRGSFLGTRKFIMLPFRDKYGQIQYLDLTYILPWGDIGESGGLGSDIPGVSAVGGLTRQIPVVGSPLVQAIAEIGLNKSSFTGKEIYHPWESKAEISKKISLYLYRQMAPSLAPGGYGFSRLQKSLTQEPDYRGRTSSLPTAAASTLLGLKITPIDPRQERRYWQFEVDREIREIEMEVGKVRRNRGLAPSEKAQRIQRLKRMQVALRNEHSANLRAARR